jgi:hypothetical protein
VKLVIRDADLEIKACRYRNLLALGRFDGENLALVWPWHGTSFAPDHGNALPVS